MVLAESIATGEFLIFNIFYRFEYWIRSWRGWNHNKNNRWRLNLELFVKWNIEKFKFNLLYRCQF